MIERTVRSENDHFPDRPIYIVGESLGGCLALAVAEHNPDIDLLLILANPGEKKFPVKLNKYSRMRNLSYYINSGMIIFLTHGLWKNG